VFIGWISIDSQACGRDHLDDVDHTLDGIGIRFGPCIRVEPRIVIPKPERLRTSGLVATSQAFS